MTTVWLCHEREYENDDVVEIYSQKYQAEIWLHQKEEQKQREGKKEERDWDFYPPWYSIEERAVK